MQSEIPKIKQESRRLTANALDIHSNAIILLPREESALKTLPYGGEIAQRRKRAGHKLDATSLSSPTCLINPALTSPSPALTHRAALLNY